MNTLSHHNLIFGFEFENHNKNIASRTFAETTFITPILQFLFYYKETMLKSIYSSPPSLWQLQNLILTKSKNCFFNKTIFVIWKLRLRIVLHISIKNCFTYFWMKLVNKFAIFAYRQWWLVETNWHGYCYRNKHQLLCDSFVH